MKTLIELPDTIITTKINSTKATMLALSIIVAIAMIAATIAVDPQKETTLSWVANYIIIAAIIVAVSLYFSLKQDVLIESNRPIIHKSIDFKESNYENILSAVKSNRWSDVNLLSDGGDGVAMKIEVVYTKDRSFVAYQFFKFVPHSYQPFSETIYMNSGEVVKFNLS